MRLIDLDSPQIKYLNGFEEKFMGQTVLEWLDDMPTVDAVQVVRCKDCKEWDEEKHWCSIRDSYGWDYKPNDYCSDGKRKDVGVEV